MSDMPHRVDLNRCVVETQLASRLRNVSQFERASLYGEVYATYGRESPDAMHPANEHTVGYEVAFLRRFISPDAVVAEIGPGSCELAFAIAGCCRRINGIDVAGHAAVDDRPANFRHALTEGIHLPLPEGSIDVVVSNQLMEHLHPEDADDQLHEIWRILRPGGRYICVTPNRLYGPHDSSARLKEIPCPIVDRMFVANGLHLKEYTNLELRKLLLRAGFRGTRHFAGARGHYAELPRWLMGQLEHWTRYIPPQLRKRSRLLRAVLGVRIVATK